MTVTSPTGAAAGDTQGAEPQPARPTFDVLPLSPELRETLAEIEYVHPTPVQLAVWEPATRGRDAVVQARTGTGKTAAFGLPIVDHLVKRSAHHLQVLVLCPTRELAVQVSTELERLGKRKNVRIVAIYGGAPMQRQVDALAGGAQVVVGTPGRVLDHLRRGTMEAKHVRLLVLDECDEMLSMGFERELTAILAELPKERQTLLFSATVPPDIERMAKSKLRSPEFITLSGDAVGALEILHFVYLVTGDKATTLLRILEVENPESAIVFCNTRDETEVVAAALKRQGYDAEWLNGDLPQSDREKVMTATREGRLRFLVATDVAARGIDISHLTHVINFDFPQDAEGYVHRTGRTGRAGRTGTAISLIMPQDVGPLYILRLTYKIRPVEKQIPTEGELKTRAEADLVTLLAEAFLPKGTHPDDLSLARRLLTHDQADAIVAGLLRDHLGARPTVKDEAAAARRAQQPQRGLGRGRFAPAGPPAAPRAPAGPAAAAAPAAVAAAAPAAAAPVAAVPPAAAAPERGAATVDGAPAAQPHIGARVEPREPLGPDTERSRERERERDAERRDRGPREGGGHGDRERRGPRPRRDDARRGPRGAEPDFNVGRDAAFAGPSTPEPRAAPGVEPRGRDETPPSAEPLTRPEPPMRVEPLPLAEARGAAPAGARGEGRGGPPGPPPLRRSHLRPPGERERAPGQPGAPQPTRHADFSTWQPPEEEGDDEPILGEPAPGVAARPPATPRARPAGGEGERAPREEAPREEAPREEAPRDEGDDADFVEIYVNVGRRDGARASDFQRVLVERAEAARTDVRRIRVRERNAFVSVRRAALAQAVAALNGAVIAGKEAHAEQARERAPGPGEGPEEA